jgi:hypothetical protein
MYSRGSGELLTALNDRVAAALPNILSQATIYVYQLVDGEVKVEKIDHTKAPPAAAVTA